MSVRSREERAPAWPALLALALIVVLLVTALALSVAGDNLRLNDVGWLGGQAAFALVGALILLRQPGTTVGRILTASGVLALVQACCWRYADWALALSEPAPLVSPAAWLASWAHLPMFALFLVALPLHFPDGRLLSSRWRVLWRATVGYCIALVVVEATRPGPMGDFDAPLANPLGLAVTGRITDALAPYGGGELLFAAFVGLGLAAMASVVVRYRRARAVERQQLKWFVWSLSLLVGYLVVQAVVLEAFLGLSASAVSDLLGLALLLGVPLSIGAAVLRYRLYEIDRLISRTVTYATLTAVLAVSYAGAVLALGGLVRGLGGSGDIAVAGSTLAVAALFRPARRRVQALVDRRFDRARYDAQHTVETFRDRLRAAVHLDEVAEHLVGAVTATVQPAAASLWLREGAR